MEVDLNSIDEALLSFLQGFVLPERLQRFDAVLADRTRKLTVVLENVIDEHNTQAVIRSCECFGLQDVHIIEEEGSFKPAKKVVKGSHKWMSIERYKGHADGRAECIRKLRGKGFQLIATSPKPSITDFRQINFEKPVALLFGQERDGISDFMQEAADETISIPMYGFTESFNISVAAGILLYELSKQLRASGIDWKLSAREVFELKRQWTLQSIYRPDLIIDRYRRENHG